MNIFKKTFFDGKRLAKENGLEFVDEIVGKHKNLNIFSHEFYMKEERILMFHPLNNGYTFCPLNWYIDYFETPLKIIDNVDSFNQIKNLDELLCDITDMYIKYIDDDVIISPFDFGLSLNSSPKYNYKGNASLVITNGVVKKYGTSSEILEVKKFYINEFLDRFIGLNFGVVVLNSPELKNKLDRLNYLAILKEYRQDFSTEKETVYTDTVKPYFLRAE